MMEIIMVLAGIGIMFHFLAGVGLIRFPDIYNRLHAATLSTTFGTLFIASAIMVYCVTNWNAGNTMMAFHTVVAVAALLVVNPTASHAIARAAHKSGIKPVVAFDKYKGAKK